MAGATGFIGNSLIEVLKKNHEVIALSRSEFKLNDQGKDANTVDWRKCDLFSLLETEKAVENAELGIYLVHSLRPSSQLTQGSFEDFDLIVADNFVKACSRQGIKKIIYLGGIVPSVPEKEVSRHIQSRKEVEDIFLTSDVPSIVLRAPLVVGPEGSSFHIMVRLVERLPAMLLPKWAQTKSQPISLKNTVDLIVHAAEEIEAKNQVYDIGGPDVFTYRDMMLEVAKQKNLNRTLINVPFLTPQLSSLWVQLVTGAPGKLVDPLVKGLTHDMIVDDSKKLEIPGYKLQSLSEALRDSFKQYSSKKQPHAFKKENLATREVRSVQRLALPKDWNAEQVSKEFIRWVPRMSLFLLKVLVDGSKINFCLIGTKIKFLTLEYSEKRSWANRRLFYVRDGLLVKKGNKGRLEFRVVTGGKAVIAAIHNFTPALPWYIYLWSQAQVHVLVMNLFGKHLKKIIR